MPMQQQGPVRPLTRGEQQRGLRALEELERLDQELLRRREGKPCPPSRELLYEAREQRTRELMRDA